MMDWFMLDILSTFVFALSGAMTVLDKGANHPYWFWLRAYLSAFLPSFFGGICRDLLLACRPAILTARGNLMAWLAACVCFSILYGTQKIYLLDREPIKHILMLGDGVGLIVFLVGGENRARSFGVEDPLVIILCGTLSCVGGGCTLATLNEKSLLRVLRKKAPYYLTAVAHAIIYYAMGSREYSDQDVLTVILSVSCVLTLLTLECASQLTESKEGGPAYRRASAREKLGLALSKGACFHAVLHPGKGRHLMQIIPNMENYIVVEIT